MKRRSKQQQQEKTPPSKKPSQLTPSPNSNSFSQIFESFYPRTPVRKVTSQQAFKDQLGQVMEKGVTKLAIVTQVTFQSTHQLDQIKCDFGSFQVYDKRQKSVQQDWTLLNQKQIQSYTSKTQLLQTLQSIYRGFLKNTRNFFLISTSNLLCFFGHDEDVPYALFIDRFNGELKVNQDIKRLKSNFLESRFIESRVICIDSPLTTLFPVNFTNFTTKYTLSLVLNKHIFNLFNCIANIGIEKELIDMAANYEFHNSYPNSIEIYNGVDPNTENGSDFLNKQCEYKVTYEGLFYVEQILELQQELQKRYPDIVVSDIKLNPLTTIINQQIVKQIHKMVCES